MTTKLIPDQDLSVTLAPQVNMLINGGFAFWQRGTSFSSPALGVYTADGWYCTKNGSPTFTIAREGGAGNYDVFPYSLKLDVTVAGGLGIGVIQSLEGLIGGSLNGRVISISARVKCSVANKIQIGFADAGSWRFSSSNAGTGWETLTLTTTVSAVGSNGELTAAIGCLSHLGGLAATVVSTTYIDSVMLTVGNVPINFISMHPADDLVRCQRYYEKTESNNETVAPLQRYTSQNYYQVLQRFCVQKYAVPTVTITKVNYYMGYLPTSGNANSADDKANWSAISTPTNKDAFTIYGQRTGGDQTTYNILDFIFTWTAEVT